LVVATGIEHLSSDSSANSLYLLFILDLYVKINRNISVYQTCVRIPLGYSRNSFSLKLEHLLHQSGTISNYENENVQKENYRKQ